jgi:hypothetical protein
MTKLTPGKSIKRETSYRVAEGGVLRFEAFDRYVEIWVEGQRKRRTATYEDIFRVSRPITWRKGKA